MAFIRAYSAQGDPRFKYSTMRAGRLVHARILSAMRGWRYSRSRAQRTLAGDPLNRATVQRQVHAARRYGLLAGDPFWRAMRMPAGDPFRLRLPKFLRKLSLKKIETGIGSAAKGLGALAAQGLRAALPIASQLLPGPLGSIA